MKAESRFRFHSQGQKYFFDTLNYFIIIKLLLRFCVFIDKPQSCAYTDSIRNKGGGSQWMTANGARRVTAFPDRGGCVR